MWWGMPVNQVLGRLKQDNVEFQDSVGYTKAPKNILVSQETFSKEKQKIHLFWTSQPRFYQYFWK